MLNIILQSLGLDLAIFCLDHVNSNVYVKFYQNISKGSRDRASFDFFFFFFFSEFEPRQNLDQTQMSFDYLVGYILSISMCMQNFIAIFFTVQGIGPFSLFQNLELGKASTDKKCQFAISWVRACQYQCLRKSLSKYSTQFKRRDISLFQNLALGKASTEDKCHFVIPWARSFSTSNCLKKNYQNIPNSLRVKFHFFQNLNLSKTSTNPRCHLPISWATSCQYQCVSKLSSQYFTQFKR